MTVGYRVENLRLQSGERLPLLLDSKSGIPLWDPTLFALTEFRATNRASATIEQVCRAVMIAHQAFDHLGIDLNSRLAEGRVLELSEIDALAQLASLTQKALDVLLIQDLKKPAPSRVMSLERARMAVSASEPQPQVSSETKGIRLLYIRNYVAWLVRRTLLKLNLRHEEHQALMTASQWMIDGLTARIPTSGHDSSHDPRQGVSVEVRARILEVVDPDSPENPWLGHHVRVRNQLIFHWLLFLGLRKGELMGVKLSHINSRNGEVFIPRRADDPEETRKNAAKTKTKERLLILGEALANETIFYVMNIRRTISGARRHPYLFVANGTGRALSMSAVSKIFQELRTKVPGLTDDLSPHILRHTWNDDFSELMDVRGVRPEEEDKLRKQAMGWSDQSQMAARYTLRHIKRKTNEVSLAMQEASFKKISLKK